MPRVHYARRAGTDMETTDAKPRKASLGRDGYEVLAERSKRDPFGYSDGRDRLLDEEYEPALTRDGFLDDC